MGVDYDVIIAGAGPAGGECARYIAENSKFSVLLLDRTQEIGEPKKSTAGSFQETMDVFKLPRRVAQCKINTSVFEGPTEEFSFPVKGYVLEFGKLKKFLVETAVHHGADLKIGATVTKPVVENGKVVGVEYNDAEGNHVVKGRIIIDATGPQATLATQLGMRKLEMKYHGGGMEFEMERLKLKRQNSIIFKLDERYAPGGYAWIFSTGNNHAKVGVCWVTGWKNSRETKQSMVQYLEKWIREDERLKKGVSMEMHAGDAYIDASIKKRTADNFMMIGDASCTIQPLLGEGIRPGMYSGMFAAQTAISSLRSKNTSAKQLSAFDALWNERQKNYRLSWLIAKGLGFLSNKQLDRVVRNFKKLDKDKISNFFDYPLTLNDLRKLIL